MRGHGAGKRPLRHLSPPLCTAALCVHGRVHTSQCSDGLQLASGLPSGPQAWTRTLLTHLLDHPPLPRHILLTIRPTAAGKPLWFLTDQSSSPAFSSPHPEQLLGDNATHTPQWPGTPAAPSRPLPRLPGGPSAGLPEPSPSLSWSSFLLSIYLNPTFKFLFSLENSC